MSLVETDEANFFLVFMRKRKIFNGTRLRYLVTESRINRKGIHFVLCDAKKEMTNDSYL